MVKMIGAATSNEQAASAITDLRNRNLIEEGMVLYHKKNHPTQDNYSESGMDHTSLSSLSNMLTGGELAHISFIKNNVVSETSYDTKLSDKQELLLNSGISAEGIKKIDHWLNEGKYVVFIKCKQEIPSIIELLEGLHGIDNVMEV